MQIFLGLMIPFAGTAAGAACVFFLRNQIKPMVQKALLGFASGVMVAAAVWSLLIPAMEQSNGMGKFAFVPAAVGFLLGIGFLLLMDRVTPHLHMGCDVAEGPRCSLKKTTMLVLAVTLHNIPEGMAVGVVFAGMMADSTKITLAGAMALSIGIAIQNFPEGAIISLPLKSEEGMSKGKAFLYGTLSGAVEPLAAGITILLFRFIEPILPYLLAFAAGAMIYVVVEELIPEASEGEHSNIGTIGFAAGFVLMMVLDVALG
jgi:ZIP family zinc transporter